jgi:hypothetical protein
MNYVLNDGYSIRYCVHLIFYEINDIFGPLDAVIIIMHVIYDYGMITY